MKHVQIYLCKNCNSENNLHWKTISFPITEINVCLKLVCTYKLPKTPFWQLFKGKSPLNRFKVLMSLCPTFSRLWHQCNNATSRLAYQICHSLIRMTSDTHFRVFWTGSLIWVTEVLTCLLCLPKYVRCTYLCYLNCSELGLCLVSLGDLSSMEILQKILHV